MKRTLTALLLALSLAGTADALTAQQQKMKDCNAEATTKSLSGEDRKGFLSKCLSDSAGSDSKLSNQQQKMKDCNVEAGKKKLRGPERQAFMKDCLSAQ